MKYATAQWWHIYCLKQLNFVLLDWILIINIIISNYYYDYYDLETSQMALVVKNPPANAGDIRDTGSIPRLGRFPGEGIGNPLHYFCLENSTGRWAWWVTVHGAAKSRTRLNDSELRLLLLFSRPFNMLRRFPGEGKGHPLKYSGLENSMDCIVHGVAESRTRLRDFHYTSLHLLCPRPIAKNFACLMCWGFSQQHGRLMLSLFAFHL